MTDEKKQEGYKLVQVPTEFGLAVETPSGAQISQIELLVEIANKLTELKKELIGK